MSGAEKENAPNSGTEAGGAGEDRAGHQIIIGDSIAPDNAGTDQNDLLPDAEMIREALRYLHPDGPWMVNAKTAKGMPGDIGADLDSAVQWAVEQNSAHRRNTYMAPARLRPDYTLPKKAKDVDVAGSRWLWADLDPDKKDTGKPFAERKAACLARLTTERPAEVPAPSSIVDSGGGCWGLWRLDKEADPDAIRARLRWLADRLGGDRTTDPSRIMRLPGTVNWPDEGKRAAGQVPALAKFVNRTGVAHPLSAFGVMEGVSPGGGAARVELPNDLPHVSLDDLPAAVSHRTKMLIVNGDDPDDPGKYPSRSEVLFAVLCEMVRAECTDEQMASVILDPDHCISAHVLGQPRPAQCAARQVQRARDEAFEPEMAELNMRHVVLLNEQGRTRVLEFVRTTISGQTRNMVTLQSFDDFRNRYMNRPVVVATDKDGNPVKKPLGATWLAWPHRRQNHSLVFAPGEGDEVGEQLNLWRGFGIAPAPGDWSRMLAHIRDVLAGGDPEAADYIIKWAAFAVQNPAEPAEVALVFRGKKGTGKGLFARALMRLFGQHGLHIPNGKMLTGNFNLHLRDCCLLFADEVEWHGDRQAEAALKVDLSRFDAAPLIAFTATKETDYGIETDGRIPARCGAYRADQWANA